jgi:hypothetical protein
MKNEPIPIDDDHIEYMDDPDIMKNNEDEKVDPMYVNLDQTNWLHNIEDGE